MVHTAFRKEQIVVLSEVEYSKVDEKAGASLYLRQTFPTCRLRRVLHGKSDTLLLAQIPINGDARDEINKTVLLIDKTPGLNASRSLVCRVIVSKECPERDGMLAWLYIGNLSDVAKINDITDKLASITPLASGNVLEIMETCDPTYPVILVFEFTAVSALFEFQNSMRTSIANEGSMVRTLM